jgi:TusE/DsrC/DsvC family sulfur relay protein
MSNTTAHLVDANALQKKIRRIGGRDILVDEEGFLWEAEDWAEDVAEAVALDCGIEKLSELQWRVIRFLREYYFFHGRGPLNRDLKAGLGMSLMELENAFPAGIRLGARRVAGLPNPRTCVG